MEILVKKPMRVIFLLMTGIIWFGAGCHRTEPEIDLDTTIELMEAELQTFFPAIHPSDNPSSPEKIQLGKLLFFDPILSGEKDVACATCHHPSLGFADGLPLSIGVGGTGRGPSRTEEPGGRIKRIGRSAPPVFNAAYIGMFDHHQKFKPEEAPMFWDSRTKSLEAQALLPIQNRDEMAGDAYPASLALDCVMVRLKNIPEYVSLFDIAFGTDTASVSASNLGKAMAAYQRSILSIHSPFDQYVNGNKKALSANQKKGLILFFGRANCSSCHTGPAFSNYKTMVHGAPDNPAGNNPDLGEGSAFKFKTPTLRNIALTAPYTHGGMFPTLEEALDFYASGTSDHPQVTSSMMDVHVKKLYLDPHEKQALISFLHALTDDSYDQSVPTFLPSGLPPP